MGKVHMVEQNTAPEWWDATVDVGVATVSCWHREVVRGNWFVPWEPGCWHHMKALGRAEMFGQTFSKGQSPSLASLFPLAPHGPWGWYSLTKPLPRPQALDAKDNDCSAQGLTLESKGQSLRYSSGVGPCWVAVAERQVEMP